MTKGNNILGIIPARGGSKGIPHKNIYPLLEKPLIAYSIECGIKAKEMGFLDELIVSTDDKEIAEVSVTFGAKIPFTRPPELSTDKSKSVDCMIHAIEFFERQGMYYDTVVLLQPTSPLRTVDDIINAIKIYQNSNTESLVSCYKEESISEYNSYHLSGNIGKPLNSEHNKGKRRQEIEPLYVRNGALFITDVTYMKKTKLVISDEPALYVMDREKSVNIDTIYDMKEAEWLMKRRVNNEVG